MKNMGCVQNKKVHQFQSTSKPFPVSLFTAVPFTLPCSSQSFQTCTTPPWGRWRSGGSDRWSPGRRWAGNGSDLRTRSAWSAPTPSCLGNGAQGSLGRQRSRMKISDRKVKLDGKQPACGLEVVAKTQERKAHNGTCVTWFNQDSSERIL